jgi:carbonic anhydrase/acetyltransferase-like protein (isoleucine patch superfamily)
MGIPARVVRELTKEEIEYLRASNERYVERAQVFPVTGKGG